MDVPKDLILPLGHDVFALPVHAHADDCQNIRPDDFAALGLSGPELHERALENLEALARGAAIQKATHQVPDGYEVIVWSGHWLVAACMRLPRLYDFAAQRLGCDGLCISIPQRERMFVFPSGTLAERDRMRAIIRDNESEAGHKITWQLFSLSPEGIAPLIEGV